jgi:hypothetical protein
MANLNPGERFAMKGKNGVSSITGVLPWMTSKILDYAPVAQLGEPAEDKCPANICPSERFAMEGKAGVSNDSDVSP